MAEENPISKGTFAIHNRKSTNVFQVEKVMGSKNRINTLYEQRNGCKLVALGDKIYKSPEFSTGFFKDGGLITGSTNAARKNTGGQGKNIDFYSGLTLDQPLNKNAKTYAQVTKE